jgi:DNA-binding MarR family transcriptional regulator
MPSSALEELARELVTASRALVGIAVRSVASAPVELTVPQHRALVLIGSGRATGVTALADAMGVNQSNASRLVDRLQRMHLVTRKRSADDGRATVLALTTAGERALDAVDERRRSEVIEVLARMDPDDAARAVRAMHAFNAAAHEITDPEH